MFILPSLAAIGASIGWATGIVLAHTPAKQLGTFEFTRIQLIASGAIIGIACTALGYWPSVNWSYWPSFSSSIIIGILLGNLAMIECLRRGGPRRTELLLSLKAPLVTMMAFFWLGEKPSAIDLGGGVLSLTGVYLAIVFGAGKTEAIHGKYHHMILLGLAATVFHGIGFLILKPAMLAGTEPLAASAIRLLGAAMIISVVALWPLSIFRPHTELTPKLLGKTILPGFIGYGISSTLLLFAFANFDAGVATVLGSLSPVLVLFILWIKENRAPTVQAMLGSVLAVGGAGIIVVF